MTAQQLATFAKKYGATGVMAVWLFIQQGQIAGVQEKLYECYDERVKPELSSAPEERRQDTHDAPNLIAVLTAEVKPTNKRKATQ